MLGRFGPFRLFDFNEIKNQKVFSALLKLHKIASASRSRHWKHYVENYDEIYLLTQWVQEYSNAISDIFPKTKSGLFYINRHLIIKEFGLTRKHTEMGPGTIGFEGSNYRLAVRADKDRKLACFYGEFANLSGNNMEYRFNFPKPLFCDHCKEGSPKNICAICGRWFCDSCGSYCKHCQKKICTLCDNKKGTYYSPHDWYYHRFTPV